MSADPFAWTGSWYTRSMFNHMCALSIKYFAKMFSGGISVNRWKSEDSMKQFPIVKWDEHCSQQWLKPIFIYHTIWMTILHFYYLNSSRAKTDRGLFSVYPDKTRATKGPRYVFAVQQHFGSDCCGWLDCRLRLHRGWLLHLQCRLHLILHRYNLLLLLHQLLLERCCNLL